MWNEKKRMIINFHNNIEKTLMNVNKIKSDIKTAFFPVPCQQFCVWTEQENQPPQQFFFFNGKSMFV